MGLGDNAGLTGGQTQFDLLIVGGGIIGCWTAYKAGRAGLKTLLVEKQEIGAGASGGVLGALMPHMPERWDGKKQFQFEALNDLPNEIAELEDLTALSCGYNQCGRVAPIMNETKRDQMLAHQPNTEKFWLGKYDWEVLDQPPNDNWPISSKAEFGVVYDSLSARVNPRKLLHALKRVIELDSKVTVREGAELASYDAKQNIASFDDGAAIRYSHIVLAAGPGTFKFVAPQLSVPTLALGKPVKGQAAIMKADVDPSLPIMFDMGLYVIAHDDGEVAIGSTSELEFSSATDTDHQIEKLIERAREYCPVLKDADVIERWAGLRPRAAGRDPLIDVLPESENVIVSTSGFKITFGVAHKMADVAIETVLGEKKTEVPESFRIPSHLAKARRAEIQDKLS